MSLLNKEMVEARIDESIERQKKSIDIYHHENNDAIVVKTELRAHLLTYEMLDEIFHDHITSRQLLDEVLTAMCIEDEHIPEVLSKITNIYSKRSNLTE